MKETKTKKIPIVSYLCYLLVVSVLFTGVTFSRYSAVTTGNTGAALSPFIATYEINDLSSSTFPNGDYFLATGEALGTARTLRFTIGNTDGGRVSDVDLQATVRLYVPEELASTLVLQVASYEDNTPVAVTPQYLVGNLVYNVEQVTVTDETTGEEHTEYAYTDGDSSAGTQKTYADYTSGGTLDTALFKDYESRGGTDEMLAMSGGLTENGGTVTATAENSGNRITISSNKVTARYSVGFSRGRYVSGTDANGEPTAEIASPVEEPLYIDVEEEISLYTIDIDLGALLFFQGAASAAAEGKTDYRGKEVSYVLFISFAERIESEDYGVIWTEEFEKFLTVPKREDPLMKFNGATVIGYHFDVDAPTATLSGGIFADRGETTTLRIQKRYGVDSGAYTGDFETRYYHVTAASSEAGADFIDVHEIENFYGADGAPAETRPSHEQLAGGMYGLCSNFAEDPFASDLYYIGFKDIADHPFYRTYTDQTNAADKAEDGVVIGSDDWVSLNGRQFGLDRSLSKSYPSRVTVLFVQISESLSSQGGDGV